MVGGRVVSNSELLVRHPGRTSADVVQRTGIESRHWIAEGEDVVSLAVGACRGALEGAGLSLQDIDSVICSTGTPAGSTPSLACRILAELGQRGRTASAHDVSAACSGYLYALGAAFDYLRSRPEARVLVVTAEVLSPLLDLGDFDTAFLFGDAATATVVAGEAHQSTFRARLHAPVLSARGENGSALAVPFPGQGRHVRMKGTRVFPEAVRAMSEVLRRACLAAAIEPSGLSLVVPHQANDRIVDSIANRTGARTFSNIRRLGNTSSSSIPLALVEVLPGARPGDRLGLCAFGGGFTSGAALLDVLGPGDHS